MTKTRRDGESNDKDDQERVMKGPKRSRQDKLPNHQEVDNPQWKPAGNRIYEQVQRRRAAWRPSLRRPARTTIITWTIETCLADIAQVSLRVARIWGGRGCDGEIAALLAHQSGSSETTAANPLTIVNL